MTSRRGLLGGAAAIALATLAECSRPTLSSGSDSSPPIGPEPSATATGSPAPPVTQMTQAPSASVALGPPSPRVAGTVAEGLDVPWGIVFTPAGDALVSERDSGRIVVISGGGAVTTLGVVPGVQPPTGAGEGGLLGLALHPDDPTTLFAYLTTASDNRVVRMSLAGGVLGKPEPILTGIPTSVHHHGGKLLFDADKMLLVSVGDAENPASAQDKDALTGKILRIQVDGSPAPGNPFGNRTWTYGHRNIEGMAFDSDGRLWSTEFGDKAADELNLITKGSNYGWPRFEGKSDSPGYVSPVLTWSPTSTCSPAGLAVARSTAFVGALMGKCLFAVPLSGTTAGPPVAHFAGEYGRIRTVVVTPAGDLWITTSNTDGRTDPGKGDDRILRVTL